MPGCSLIKIGNLGIPCLLLPINLKVTVDPILGGFILYLSSKPDPILNSVPSFSLTTMAPIMPEHLPVPLL